MLRLPSGISSGTAPGHGKTTHPDYCQHQNHYKLTSYFSFIPLDLYSVYCVKNHSRLLNTLSHEVRMN